MCPGFRQILFLVCIAGVWGWSGSTFATTWQEHRDAGVTAFDSGDYSEAVTQFERASSFAKEAGATGQERGLLLEHLATAYLANKQYQQAQETIVLWDGVLAENEGQAWTADHGLVRDRLATFVSKSMDGAADGDGPGAAAAPAQPPVEDANPQIALEAYAVHLASARSENSAKFIWGNLKERYPQLLNGKRLALKQIDLGDRGHFVRVVAIPYESAASAKSACAEFRNEDQFCAVMSVE